MAVSTTIILQLLNSEKTVDEPIFISDQAQKIGEEMLLEELITTIRNVHSTINLTSALPGHEHHANRVELARSNLDETLFSMVKDIPQLNETRLLKLFAKAIEAQQAGNCYEFAIYARILLARAGISSEVFRIKGTTTQNSHVFLVLNRPFSTDISDYTSWPSTTLVFDPYLKKIYSASEMLAFLQSCEYIESLNAVQYIPFNPKEHSMDNKVIDEFVEDWLKVKLTGKPLSGSAVSVDRTAEPEDDQIASIIKI